MNRVIVSIGSNIDPDEHIRRMLDILRAESCLIGVSEFVRTKPIGIENQPDFVNGAALIETPLDRPELTRYLKSVEDRLGRDRSQARFGPRTIDLDIVVWNNQVVDDDYHTRDFIRKAAASLGFNS